MPHPVHRHPAPGLTQKSESQPWTRRLHWPLPALLAWAAGGLAWRLVLLVFGHAGLALAAGSAVGILLGLLLCRGAWRRLIAGAGFPLALALLTQGQGGSVWSPLWLAALLPLLALYPPRAWADAPLFPTPRQALLGLSDCVGQPLQVLDAGCGLGHGLRALRQQFPAARLVGVEWSPLLAVIASILSRLRLARLETAATATETVQRGDMWAHDWSSYQLVYLFQRPESMPRAWAKACAEMAPGSFLVSLEFAIPGQRPLAVLTQGSRRPVWVYPLPRRR